MVPTEDELAVPVLLPAELTGDGLRDMGEGVSVLLQEGEKSETPSHPHFTAILHALEKLTLHPSQGRVCSGTS